MTHVRAFTSRSDGISLDLDSPIGVSTTGDPEPVDLAFRGIWDTGATGCAITKRVADMIGAKPTGFASVGGVHGVEVVNEYIVDLYLPNRTLIKDVNATELNESAACDFLIGMDIISLGDFAVSNFQGKTFFTFRAPSIAHADYTTQKPTQFQAIKPEAKTRNSPCPCGSGKKYKQCCGNK